MHTRRPRVSLSAAGTRALHLDHVALALRALREAVLAWRRAGSVLVPPRPAPSPWLDVLP